MHNFRQLPRVHLYLCCFLLLADTLLASSSHSDKPTAVHQSARASIENGQSSTVPMYLSASHFTAQNITKYRPPPFAYHHQHITPPPPTLLPLPVYTTPVHLTPSDQPPAHLYASPLLAIRTTSPQASGICDQKMPDSSNSRVSLCVAGPCACRARQASWHV